MLKPETMCDELGCTRDWTIIVKSYGHPDHAPASSTEMNKKVCDPCAGNHERLMALRP